MLNTLKLIISPLIELTKANFQNIPQNDKSVFRVHPDLTQNMNLIIYLLYYLNVE